MTPFIIAHSLQKQSGETKKSTLHLRDSIYEQENPAIEGLLSGLRNSVSRSSKIGKFERDEDDGKKILERLLIAFQTDSTEDNFVNFTKKSVVELQKRLEAKVQATGGYVVFCYYESNSGAQAGEKYLVIALITQQSVPAFNEMMELTNPSVLDLDNLKHGARIRLSDLEGNFDGVVSLLPSRRAAQTASYFSDFIGCSEFTDSNKMATRLDERFAEWCENQDLSDEEASEKRFALYRHHKDNKGSTDGISIEALGNSLYPEGSSDFVSFMTSENGGLPGHTPPIKARDMGRFGKFRFSAPGFKLEFDTGGKHGWQNQIEPKGDDILIKNAPKALINRLKDGNVTDE